MSSRFRIGFCAVLLFLGADVASATAAEPQQPSAAEILGRVRGDHPRLLATADDFAAIRRRLEHPNVAPVFAGVRAQADAVLARPPARHELRDGKRLLFVSREVRDAVLALGLAFRLTGDARYADRLWAEVDAVTKFPDWNPAHFLDTAEMTCAVALAYDWLYDRWSDGQRKQIRAAMLELGLKPALAVYRDEKRRGFPWRVNNWNQVCNGGILAGALAIAGDEPAAAGEVLEHAVRSLPLAMAKFAPDGAWGEGPSYWAYATEYNCIAVAALRTATGTDFGLSAMPGFSRTGDMPLAFTGPIGLTFNYADAGPGFAGASQLFWLASAFNTPAYAAFQIPYARANPRPFDLLWGAEWFAREPKPTGRPLDLMFRGDDILYLRSAWADPRALFVAFKGGDNRVNHSQLDLGSFVFDALGQRWAMDVGPDDYNRPGYFEAKGRRWTFYRCRAEGNNCLVLNPGPEPDQSPTAAATVAQFHSTADRSGAVVDLTAAYAKHAREVRRGIAMLDRKRVLIQDELRAADDAPVEYLWFMHTEAEVAVAGDGATATLTRGGETLTARVVSSPPGAKFTVMGAESLPTSPPEPPAAERPLMARRAGLENVRKLTVRVEGAKDLRVAVVLDPGKGGAPLPEIVPLSDWPATTAAAPTDEAGAGPAGAVSKPPAELNLDPFYEKYVDVNGLPVVGSSKVPDAALLAAADLLRNMLAKRPDLPRAMADANVKLAVMARGEVTTDVPEHSRLRPKDYWDRRARGLGGTRRIPTTSCAEENVLGHDDDRYCGESILIHEFAHTVHEVGLAALDEGFDARLKSLHERAVAKGLWAGTYAATNRNEYWAEGVQSYFDCNARSEPPNGVHNHVRTREQLKEYDPDLAALVAEAFGGNEWRWTPNAAHRRKW